MAQRFRVGVIGVGAIATDEVHGHIPNYLRIPEVEVVALSDVNGRRARHIADHFDIPHAYTHYREMLTHHPDLDAVSICTPNYLHASIAVGCLQAGVHVLVEKPMAMTSADAERMVATAQASGKQLFVGMNNRFRDDVRAMKLMVANGALGRVHAVKATWLRPYDAPEMTTWFTSKVQSGGGPLWDTGLVMLDLALWMLDFPKAVAVAGALSTEVLPNPDNEAPASVLLDPNTTSPYPVEDAAQALIRLDGGITLGLEVSWVSLIGNEDKIFLRLDGSTGAAELHNPDFDTSEPLRVHGELFGTRMEFAPRIQPSAESTHRVELEHFVDVCRGREAPLVTPEQALMGVRLIESIYHSATQGTMVRFDGG